MISCASLYTAHPFNLISIYKLYAIDIADPSSMQDACHKNFVMESLWLSGRASERET